MNAKRTLTTIAAGLLLSGAVAAQPYGMGPGMMGSYGGGYGMGPGMMGGYGGYGMGPRMMGSYGGCGMGPGMMWGSANQAYAGLDLTADQRKRIAEIEEQTSKAMWQLMGTMHEQGYHMAGVFGANPVDDAAARKAYQTMSETRKAMFDLQLDARKRIDALLTKEQRKQLNRYGSR